MPPLAMKGEKRHESIAYRPNDRRIGYLIRNSIYNLQDVIVLKEWLDHEHTMEYVKNSILYLTVSRYEGLPLAVIEAMAMGKCIVASKVVGNVDCVKDKYNGRVIDLNVEDFVNSICELIENRELLEEYSRNSRKMYEDNFDIKKRINLLEDIYRQVAK